MSIETQQDQQEQQQQRPFGANDRPACPVCKASMLVIRRTPHPKLGANYESQTLECPNGHTIERTVDEFGRPPDSA